MRLFGFLPVFGRRVVVAFGVAGMVLMASTAQAQDPAAQQAAAPAAAQPDPFTFDGSNPALLMLSIKRGEEATFEAAFTEMKAKLAASEKQTAKDQSSTFDLLKLAAALPEGQPAIYVVVVNKPVAGVSYSIEKILEGVGEWRADSELYKKFVAAIAQWQPWPMIRK